MPQLSPVTGFFFILVLGEAVGASAVIWDQDNLRLKCVLGSILASIALIAWRGMDSTSEQSQHLHLRGMCREFIVSALAGVLGTPLLIWYLRLPPHGDLVWGLSGAVSFSATTALRISWPILQQAWDRWIKGKLGASN